MTCCFLLRVLVLCSSFLFKMAQCEETHVIVEKGEHAVIKCSLPSSVNSVVWQVLRVGRYIDASTCSPNSCTDHLSFNFKGNMFSSAGGYTSTLVIYSATTSDTQFRCLTDTYYLAAKITLDIYVLPSTPTCRTSYTLNQYVELICETSNVYPTFGATPHRRENDLFEVDDNTRRCIYHPIGTGSKGDRFGICTWRIPYSSLLEKNTFYVEMTSVLLNGTVVGKPVVSRDTTFTLRLEHVTVSDCPTGRCMRGQSIKRNAVICCKCELTKFGSMDARASWYKQDGTVIGTENNSGRVSLVTIVYNASDPHATYECRAYNTSGMYYHIAYQPDFSSSSSDEEVIILTNEKVAGFVAVPIVLCAIVAAVILKWRNNRKRRSATTTMVVLF